MNYGNASIFCVEFQHPNVKWLAKVGNLCKVDGHWNPMNEPMVRRESLLYISPYSKTGPLKKATLFKSAGQESFYFLPTNCMGMKATGEFNHSKAVCHFLPQCVSQTAWAPIVNLKAVLPCS